MKPYLFTSCFLLLAVLLLSNQASRTAFCAFELRGERICTANNALSLSEDKRIDWEKERLLTWKDFQGVPYVNKPNIAAVTTSLIQYRWMCKDGYLRTHCKAVFLKDESWVRLDSKNKRVLGHEQGHFNITEVYARKLQIMMDQRKYGCDEEAKLEADIEEVLEKWRDLETRYDKSTAYSLNVKMQRQWDKYVADLLTETVSYK